MKRNFLTHILLAALTVAMINCSSSGTTTNTGTGSNADANINTGTGTGDSSADTQATFSSAFTISQQALTTAFAGGSASALIKLATVIEEQEYDCSTSGTYTFSGSYDAPSSSMFTYDFNLGYNDCDGLNGDLEMNGDYSITSTEYSYESSISGSIGGNGCEINFDNFGYTFYFSTSTSQYTGTYNGSYSSECGDDLVECTFDNVSIYDYDAFYSSCTLNGEALDDSSSSSSLEFDGDVEAFFSEQAGTYDVVATAREGVTSTLFTDGDIYTVTVSSNGDIVVETNEGDISMTFDAEGYYFESSAAESTMIWKASDESQVIFQIDGGLPAFVVGNASFEFWDLE